jgi:hypothetical protein
MTAAASSALIAAAPPSSAPAPSTPKPSPAPKKVSESARALARSMRAFDSHLSDADLDKIAQGIDGNLKLGAAINRGGKSLKNWDEPAAAFEATE